jgi:hypothetical protein
MRTVTINRPNFEYESHGTGEPVALIDLSLYADSFAPLMNQPATGHRLIRYDRRGHLRSQGCPYRRRTEIYASRRALDWISPIARWRCELSSGALCHGFGKRSTSRIWNARLMGPVTETGASWRGYGRSAASRKWGGLLPCRPWWSRGAGLVAVPQTAGFTQYVASWTQAEFHACPRGARWPPVHCSR